MKTLLAITGAAALLALGACDSPPTEENETATAFPGSDAVEDETAAPGTNPPPMDEGEPAANPPPTLPPEDDPTSPAAGETSPPER